MSLEYLKVKPDELIWSLKLHFCQATLNFTTVLTQPADMAWGALDAEGWSGIIGNIYNNRWTFRNP